jgi:type II secretory pathway component PulF
MARYVYTARDSQGRQLSGEVEAAGQEEALARLSAQGLQADPAALREIPAWVAASPRLSAEEAAELAGQMAQMAQAGLPLASGLRAMAEESDSRRLAEVLWGIAARLDEGGTLEAAVAQQGARIPEPIRSLILAGARSGRLSIVLEELVAREQRRKNIRQQLRLTLAYPVVLLGVLRLLCAFATLFIAPQYGRLMGDFGADLPVVTRVFLWSFSPASGLGVLVLMAALAALGIACFSLRSRAAWAQELLYWVPLVGPAWRHDAISDLAALVAILLEQEVPLPQALRLAAEALQEADLKEACRGAAEAVESGQPLSECLGRFEQFPSGLRPFVEWGERTPALAESFRAAAAMFDAQARVRTRLLEGVLLPFAFLAVVGFLAFWYTALMLPLVSLIQSLS